MCALLLTATLGCADRGDAIYVISREDGSGTRDAFVQLTGILQPDENGVKWDHTLRTAEITNSTSVMMLSVSGDPHAIGYISLGSLNASVKGLRIDGVAPTADDIASGAYRLSRPFNIVLGQQSNVLADDFVAYITSAEGQAVAAANGYVPIEDAVGFSGRRPAGKLVIAGSSSVAPLMEKLAEAYLALNPGADIETQVSDSTTGINAIIEGIADIGMSSRPLKPSEEEKGVTATVIALDGIVVIVSNANPVSGLSLDEVRAVFTGSITSWAQVRTP